MTSLSSNRLTCSCVRLTPIASLHLPVKTRIARCSCRNVLARRRSRRTCRLDLQEAHDFRHHGVVFLCHYFHSCFLSIYKKILLEFAPFFHDANPAAFKNVLHSCCKFEHRIFIPRKGLAMLYSYWVSTQTLMPAWRAENPSLTSSPVRPFRSFEAAKSSRKMRVLVPSKQKLVSFSQISTWCCSQMMTYSRGSLSANPAQRFLKAKVGQISTMLSNLPLNGPQSWFTRNCVLSKFVGLTINALNGIFPGSISVLHIK